MNATLQDEAKGSFGSSTSDSRGHFTIVVGDSLSDRRSLCLVRDCSETFVIEVVGTAGETLMRSDQLVVGTAGVDVTLGVSLPVQKIRRASWAELGAVAEKTRLMRVSDLVKELAIAKGEDGFGSWTTELRHAVIGQLERGFLDSQGVLSAHVAPPHLYELRAPGALEQYRSELGDAVNEPAVSSALAEFEAKAETFPELGAVDWLVDPRELARGAPGAAITKFQGLYMILADEKSAASPGLVDEPTNLSNYRDYLRAIWTGNPSNGAAQPLQQLGDRFHQDFETMSTDQQPANEIAIEILTAILNSPPGAEYGFGIAPGAIPPRGPATARQYLDELIALTGLSATELGLRYRLDFQRRDDALSSPVEENIATLQGFFRDGFQSLPEPFPIVPDQLLGQAPFFLEYEEWLRARAPYYAENLYQVRQLANEAGLVVGGPVSTSLASASVDYAGQQVDERKEIATLAASAPTNWKWVGDLVLLEDELVAAAQSFRRGEYADARQRYLAAAPDANSLINKLPDPVLTGAFELAPVYQSEFLARKSFTVNDGAALTALTERYHASRIDPGAAAQGQTIQGGKPYTDWLDSNRQRLEFGVVYLAVYVIPACLGDTALALGDYAEAVAWYGLTTRFLVGAAEAEAPAGWKTFSDLPRSTVFLYHDGDLPYTAEVHRRPGESSGTDDYPRTGSDSSDIALGFIGGRVDSLLVRDLTNPMEAAFFRLRQGNALLEWADALYRSDDEAAKERARELYKAVLFLHQSPPPIDPHWNGAHPGLQFVAGLKNPAIVSQQARARLALTQLAAGLNYYGYNDELVPLLRYGPLADAAAGFAALAKSAQADFLAFVEKLEAELIDDMKTSNMLAKAQMQRQAAEQQAAVAQDEVTQAQLQIDQINNDIQAKQQEIDDHDSLVGQVSDFASGLVGAVKDLPSDTKSSVGDGLTALVKGEEFTRAGFLGLGTTGAVLGGFGIFAYAAYTSLNSMTDAANKRQGDLNKLRTIVLPAAAAQLDAKTREVTIATIQRQIATADAQLAKDLLAFQGVRFLNAEFWATVAAVMQRVMRRYVELSSRAGWLAERALAYEQDRPLDTIGFDYFPQRLLNVTGADLLQLDLAQLAAARIEGIKETVPIEITLSIARDFPLEFAQLRANGRCTFRTEELPLRQAYPGTYGYRLRALIPTVSSSAVTRPPRGLLSNGGASLLSRADASLHISLRPADALPLSEFRLRDDMGVYSLPDEALLAFEGSGIDTLWSLEFPAAANPYGLDSVSDILLTLDLRARFSLELYAQDIAAPPSSVNRLVLFNASRYDPASLIALQDPAAMQPMIAFDVNVAGLPRHESNRRLQNVFVVAAGATPLSFTAVLSSTTPQRDIGVKFDRGNVASNAPPLTDAQSKVPPSPLNALAGTVVDQIFRLRIDKAKNAGVDFSTVRDVVLGIDYSAKLA